jgi:Matrixin
VTRILPGMVLPEMLPAAQPPPPDLSPVSERWKVKWQIGVAVFGVLLLVKVAGAWGGLGGHYAFLATQGDDPVTWNHCQAIRYTVNPKGAPENWQEIVHRAVDDVEGASGFVFADLGTTTKTQLIGSRYQGNEWEPVLILWSDRYQDGSLGGGVIGRGGPAAINVNGRQRYVTGKVSLDSTVRDPAATRLVLEHELGHVLGLDHSSDSDQLMYAGYHGQEGLGDGDREGLQRLHAVPCD